MTKLPLADITILDLTWVIAGPHATRLFADLGARVIKVESSFTFDVARSSARRRNSDNPRSEGGWAYQDLNHSKLDIAINLKSAKGREALEELVKLSDIVICNYSARAFTKLGLRFEDLSQIKPDIIVLNASGLGDGGPYSGFVTYAPVLQAITGIAALAGYEGGAPFDEYPPFSDYVGGLAAANCLLAAIEYRRSTGKGQFIDLSQGEAAANYMGTAVLDAQVNGTKSRCIGNRHFAGDLAPHNCYRCRGEGQQWCVIAVESEAEWAAFCQVVDPERAWCIDGKFISREQRLAHIEELDGQVEQWTLKHTPAEVGELLQAAGVSAAPVQFATYCLWRDQHLQARGYYREVVFPASDDYPASWKVTGNLVKLSDIPDLKTLAPAPAVGQDTEYILSELLGKTPQWIAAAAEEQAFV
jgi:crotonobetainyl-CoA:carnitine CoA-transferase CaiB-like acyl-CoA transferase